MMAWLLLKASTSAVAVALASAILARDHGLLANRLIAAFFYCVAGWAGLEFLLHQQTEAGSLQLRLPLPPSTQAQRVLQLRREGASSPHALGTGADLRELGFALILAETR